MDIAKALREYQEQDLETGLFFRSVHEFTLRTLIEFFRRDMDEMGYPCFRFERIPGERLAEYRSLDGYRLSNVITIDPFKLENGDQIPELIAHELVHQWLYMLEYDQSGNAHEQPFMDKMMDYGIVTEQGSGNHIGTVSDIWENFLAENDDIRFHRFMLGELDAEDTGGSNTD
jgi:hypothetical protein